MQILECLKFVQGAVSRKDFLPAMTHFAIEGGMVRAYNGSLALSSPIPFNIDCNPKADSMVQAISNCVDHVTLAMTKTGKLSIKSGNFQAYIDCIKEEVPRAIPEGREVRNFDGAAMLEALKVLYPFIGEDASRPFCNGVLLNGQTASATNNISLIQYWVGSVFPVTVNIPRAAVRELLRINDPPIRAQSTDNSMTFHYSDGRWVRTQLLDVGWPDMDKILNVTSHQMPMPQGLFEALEALKTFVDKLGRVYMNHGLVSTTMEEGEGAKFEVPELQHEGIYRIEMLSLLKGVAETIDFTSYPAPAMFFGKNLRGAIIGMRL